MWSSFEHVHVAPRKILIVCVGQEIFFFELACTMNFFFFFLSLHVVHKNFLRVSLRAENFLCVCVANRKIFKNACCM